ncbi:LPXTG cell wall anchor domain-containing protein [Schaalia sp. 19OD2882]|uniref:SdrD B-like domain-containing protein n=1 Tax=Schaalia sp. 19OD2882 TaxID=2794089 RepID=UPI001C1EAD4C|nr:SdrD B-like domain-containing protein [Schaalia sp. 19OD2882]QWW19385.1 LPXTG cell wall anchor domain-containing protein [Schaalia sp. 19OD2882]
MWPRLDEEAPWRKIGALLLTLALALTMVGAYTVQAARAADDVNISLNVVKLVKSDFDGNVEKDEQLVQWNVAKLVVNWDASTAAIGNGASFRIGLPDPFNFRGYPRTDKMTTRDAGGVDRVVGECVTLRSEMVCTFNQEGENLYNAGFRNFTGTNSMLLTAVKNHAGETAKFNLNGKLVDVDLPGTGGIALEKWGPVTLVKWINNVLTKDTVDNTWVIKFGTDYMRDNVKPAGTIKTDGSVSTLVLHDVMAPGQKFNPARAGDAKLRIAGRQDNPQDYQQIWSLENGTQVPGWNVELIENSPTDIDVKITGPFPPSANMDLTLPVKFDEAAKPGVVYSNTISAEGLDKTVTSTSYYVDTVEITVNMEPGYGTFKVQKFIEGDGAAKVDANAKFPVKVDFMLPYHYNTYNPVWQPPAGFTMDADGIHGHGTFMVQAGKSVYFDPNVTIPLGTEVTLSEDPNGVSPAAPVTWGTPVFDKKTFTIADQKVTAVKLTNKATKVAAVRVGDHVWEDAGTSGTVDHVQGEGDKPIPNVKLSISRSDGAPVNNADGSARAELTTTTDASGKYLFDNLQVLPAGTHYVVTIDKTTVPAGLEPVKDKQGGDRAKDSEAEAGKAESSDLTADGAEDLTLDFGFKKAGKPGIDIEKYDGTWEGVKFDAAGKPDLTGGQPTNQPAGDRDSADQALTVERGAPTNVTFTVTNTGEVELNKLVVTDATDAGAALTDIVCKVGGKEYPGDGIDPTIVLTPQASFQCSGTLPTITEAHQDTATVSATPVAGGQPLTDSDTWHALPPKAKVAVGDYVWEDVNGDGVQDGSDVPIKDVELKVSRSDGLPVRNFDGTDASVTTKTDDQGHYLFEGLEVLPAGVHYVVTVTAPQGFVPTKDGQGGRDKDSSAVAGKAESTDLTQDGAEDLTLDFGYVKAKPGIDVEKYSGSLATGDADTVQSAVPVGAAEATAVTFDVVNTSNEDLVKLTFADVATDGPSLVDLSCTLDGVTVKAVDGVVTFDPASVLKVGQKYTCSANLAAMGTDMTHADRVTVGGVGVSSGEPVTDGDEWHAKTPRGKVTVGDYVWFDENGNGIQDAGEPGIEGVELSITDDAGNPVVDVEGNPVGPVLTDGNGYYEFSKLPVGKKYTVTVTKGPDGYEPTKAGAGDRDRDSSTGKETSVLLPKDGDKDMTLDFGFVKKSVPPVAPPAKESKLPVTGSATGVILAVAGVALVGGGIALALRRRNRK